MKPCIENPKTGKPFSRHKYSPVHVKVTSYVGSFSGGMSPGSYAYDLKCHRCGFYNGTKSY
jgi:hypothetical protein